MQRMCGPTAGAKRFSDSVSIDAIETFHQLGTASLQVVGIVSRCSENTDADVQLAVIRALLTITTAEHFRAHGDCLVQVPVDFAV